MSNTQLQISLIQEIKNFLEITVDMNSFELFRLLKDVRSVSHPDKFTDEALKTKAEERFRIANDFLTRLEKFIQEEKVISKSTDVVKYKNDYEIVSITQDNFTKDTQITELKNILKTVENENEQLRSNLKLFEENMSSEESLI